jgi:hypothetical protein
MFTPHSQAFRIVCTYYLMTGLGSLSTVQQTAQLLQNGKCSHPFVKWWGSIYTGPYLGILRPWAQENFAPPPPYFVRIQLCVSKNNTKN